MFSKVTLAALSLASAVFATDPAACPYLNGVVEAFGEEGATSYCSMYLGISTVTQTTSVDSTTVESATETTWAETITFTADTVTSISTEWTSATDTGCTSAATILKRGAVRTVVVTATTTVCPCTEAPKKTPCFEPHAGSSAYAEYSPMTTAVKSSLANGYGSYSNSMPSGVYSAGSSSSEYYPVFSGSASSSTSAPYYPVPSNGTSAIYGSSGYSYGTSVTSKPYYPAPSNSSTAYGSTGYVSYSAYYPAPSNSSTIYGSTGYVSSSIYYPAPSNSSSMAYATTAYSTGVFSTSSLIPSSSVAPTDLSSACECLSLTTPTSTITSVNSVTSTDTSTTTITPSATFTPSITVTITATSTTTTECPAACTATPYWTSDNLSSSTSVCGQVLQPRMPSSAFFLGESGAPSLDYCRIIAQTYHFASFFINNGVCFYYNAVFSNVLPHTPGMEAVTATYYDTDCFQEITPCPATTTGSGGYTQ